MVGPFYLSRNKLKITGAMFVIGLIVLGSCLLFCGKQEKGATVLEPIYNGNPDKKAVALAVNVDWGEDIVPKFLKVFEQEDIVATFFVTGRFAGKFPDTIKQIAEAKHEIGNHGYSHKHPDKTGFGDNQLEIRNTEQELQKIVDNPAKLYAPPYGECSPPVVEAAEKLGYKTIMWTVDTVDWQAGKTAQGIAEKVISNAQNGAIILMHPKEVSLEALPIIIKELKAEGYQFQKISQIIKTSKGQNN